MKKISKAFLSVLAVAGGACTLQALNSAQATIPTQTDMQLSDQNVGKQEHNSDVGDISHDSKVNQTLRDLVTQIKSTHEDDLSVVKRTCDTEVREDVERDISSEIDKMKDISETVQQPCDVEVIENVNKDGEIDESSEFQKSLIQWYGTAILNAKTVKELEGDLLDEIQNTDNLLAEKTRMFILELLHLSAPKIYKSEILNAKTVDQLNELVLEINNSKILEEEKKKDLLSEIEEQKSCENIILNAKTVEELETYATQIKSTDEDMKKVRIDKLRLAVYNLCKNEILQIQTFGQLDVVIAKIKNSKMLEESTKENLLLETDRIFENQEELFKVYNFFILPNMTYKQLKDLIYVIENSKLFPESKGHFLSILNEQYRNYIDLFINNIPDMDIKEKPQFIYGLSNVGNSCYLNSVIQQLYRCPEFRAYLKDLRELDLKEKSDKFVVIYYNIMKLFEVLDDGPENQNIEEYVYEIRSVLFPQNIDGQMDAAECFRLICENLNFKFNLKTYTKISTNGEEHKTSEEIFSILPLTIPEKSDNISVQDCLKQYLALESLTGDNQYQLSDGRKVDATRQIYISSAPQTLLISLGRFFYNKETSKTEKIEKKVSINEKIEVSINEKIQCYRLVGVIRHIGEDNDGHYISYVLDSYENIWNEFNDEEVNEFHDFCDMKNDFSDDYMLTLENEAYILRYERID